MQKKYIIVMIVIAIVSVLIWKLSSTYALYNQDLTGNNFVTGNDWSVNIMSLGDINLEGEAELLKEISTIGTTLNFEVYLPHPDSSLTFTFEIENMGKIEAELYALTLIGLSSLQSEYIDYTITPLDYITVKNQKEMGSILKKNERHTYQITVKYQDSVNENNFVESTLNLGANIIYEQK